MKEIDRLNKLLFPEGSKGSKVVDLKFFPGEQPVTVEEFCKDVHAAFVQVESGQSLTTENFVENVQRVPVERFLNPA